MRVTGDGSVVSARAQARGQYASATAAVKPVFVLHHAQPEVGKGSMTPDQIREAGRLSGRASEAESLTRSSCAMQESSGA
ncbi:hypothetical protein [Streptomyces sp. NPDC051677]|uniref:hypothetical protein n=1 Tax=Streptomyces sp. NPDC051677 TaxID=3365669 RepID=UPI0037D75D0E